MKYIGYNSKCQKNFHQKKLEECPLKILIKPICLQQLTHVGHSTTFKWEKDKPTSNCALADNFPAFEF
jgi:hypothetical protein